MKIKKTFIITLFLLCLLMIGAVSAANNDTVVSSDVDDDTLTSIQDNSGETSTDAVLAQADTKTVSNNNDEPILKESKEIDVTNYTGLVDAIKEAENIEYSQYKINLLPGNYNATQSMVWQNSATRDITINGNNNILDGQGLYQFMNIAKSHNLTVENITFANFKVTKTDDDDNVPGNGGVFYINGKLTANNAKFINNYAIKRGGAIYNYGTLIINNTIFENNITSKYDGGAIANYGPLTISNSIFRGNTATDQEEQYIFMVH